MDYIYIHLLLNHIPILGGIFGMILFMAGFLRKNQSIINAGLISLVLVAIVTIPAYMSGEEAEHLVEKFAGTSEFFLEEHEEWSEVALWFMIVTGVFSLLGLLLSSMESLKKIVHYLVILFSLTTIVLMIVVGNYGGKIRHSELREKGQMTNEISKPSPNHERDDHDD